jgi:salicylate hydroxylase
MMRVLVVGGGIAGMATAIALEQAGCDPLVLEQASELAEIGSGIGLQANALRVLRSLGAADHVLRAGVRIDDDEWRRMDTGQTIFAETYEARAERYGGVYTLCMHRADLLASLAERVAPERVRLGCRFVAVRERHDGVVAVLESGEEVFGDLLIGADGLRSAVRTALFGDREARFTGFAAWRGTIPGADMPGGFEHSFVMWLGPGRHAMTFPIRADLYTFNGFVPTTEILREEWGPSGDLGDLRRSFEGATGDVLDLIDGMTSALITPISFRDPLPVWGTERIVLVGDAAHPTPPSAAQGAGQALEDSVTLAACLRRADGRDGAPAALAEFAARRKARTAAMLTAARINFGMFNEPDPLQMRARDGRLQGMLRLDPAGETMFGWLYGHDAIAAAEAPLPTAAGGSEVMSRAESQRAFALWRDAIAPEDRTRLWAGERDGYERFLQRACAPPSAVTVEQLVCDGVPTLRVVPPDGSAKHGPVVMHLHGGSYTMGSAHTAIELAARLAQVVGGWALVPDYRLAPEHPYPAALDDVVAVYGWLANEYGVDSCVVSGECAGGGLAVAMTVRLRDAGARLPAALYVVSPFADLTVTSPAATAMSDTDPWLGRDRLRLLAASYIHTADPATPLVSPVNADLRGLPPLLIQAAEGEALRDDATQLAEAAAAAGVPVTVKLVPDTVHSFVLFGFLPETAAALDEFAGHVGRTVPTGSRGEVSLGQADPGSA